MHGHSALQFVRALLKKNHTIISIFFLLDSSYIALASLDMPSDEAMLLNCWHDFLKQHSEIKALVCSSAGLRRGINKNNITNYFKLASIAELVDACDKSDRVIQL